MREINDIDLHLPHADFLRLSGLVQSYTLAEPRRIPDTVWDLWITELAYYGQLIDLSSDEEPRVRHKRTGEWVRIDANFGTDVTVVWEGLSLRVQNPRDVACYKRIISFEGDDAKHLADAAAAERWAERHLLNPGKKLDS